jgi:hypothetical protein
MPRKILRSFTMREISAVDRPAQQPAKAVIMKRDAMLYTSIEKGDLPDDVLAYLKREFSAEQRQRDASSGAALPDGSFPIENASDLHNAMQAIGRAKDPAKAKAHIRARARALGLTAELSEAFKRETAREMIGKAAGMLIESVRSIVGGKTADAAAEKLIDKSIEQFTDHIEKTVAAGDAVDKTMESEMDLNELKKALGLADTATEAEITAELAKFSGLKTSVGTLTADIAKLKHEIAIAKAAMSDDEKSFHDGLKDDGEKEKFRGMSREQRAERMKKRDDVPEHIRKALEENDDLKKRMVKLEDERALDAFKKQAKDIGLPDADGVTLQKAYRGDKESVDKLVSYLKAANAAAVEAGLFKEMGGSGGNTTLTAYDELMVKADELRKKEAGLTREQAFAKVYADPANAELAKRERKENRPAA